MAKDKNDHKKNKEERKLTASDRSAARIKQYLKIALGVLAIAFIVPVVFRFINFLNPPSYIEFIDPTPAQLHNIFFSGEPHIIFCTNRTGNEIPRLVKRVSDVAIELSTKKVVNEDSDDEEGLELSKAEKEKAYKDGLITSPVHRISVGTLDCSAPLPSGKSVLERFALTLPSMVLPGGAQPTPQQQQQMISTPPLPPAFYLANGDRPQWIPNDLFIKEDKLVPTLVVKHALSRLAPRTIPIQSEKFLGTRCINRKSCILILHSGNSNLLTATTSRSIRALHQSFPASTVATVDVKKYTLSLQKNLGKLEEEGQNKWPRLLFFRRQAAKEETKSDKKPATTLFVKSYKGAWNPTDVTDFIASLTDVPAYLTNGTAVTPNASDKPKTSLMAVLNRPPHLNYGPDNFKKPKHVDHTKKSETKKTTTSSSSTAGKTAAERKAEAEREEREERERESRRREQMEAEAAEHNFVQEVDEDVGGMDEVGEEPVEDEEVVSLDEEEEEKEL